MLAGRSVLKMLSLMGNIWLDKDLVCTSMANLVLTADAFHLKCPKGAVLMCSDLSSMKS